MAQQSIQATNGLAVAVGQALLRHGLTLVTAESCTGGGIAYAITSVPGSSRWFDRGFVTYSNAAKVAQLAVRPGTLERHGAVSEQTALEMARGALVASGAGVAIAVTGIAGPDGGTADKPVGTVCFAWVQRAGAERTARRQFHGDRGEVRAGAVQAGLAGIVALLP